MLRTLIAIICLAGLTGCAACLPGGSKLDQGMVAKTTSAEAVPASDSSAAR